MAPTPARDRPELETDRLVLRSLRIEDFDAFAAFMAEEETARFVGGIQPRPLAWRNFLQLAGAWELQGFSMFSVLLKTTGEWIGRVGPWMPEGWPGTEVGWGIVRAHCRQGYATEAAAATMDWAFSELGWTEVIHTINPANAASIAVARKLGARNRGPGRLPPPFEDIPIEIWGQTRENWLGRASGQA
jgi:RimJ/RimL family protein N-acetyltransferase